MYPQVWEKVRKTCKIIHARLKLLVEHKCIYFVNKVKQLKCVIIIPTKG